MGELDPHDRTRHLFEFTIMSPRVDTIAAWLAGAPERERADALLADWESLFRRDLAHPGRQALEHGTAADPEQALAEVIRRREQLAAAAVRTVRAAETVAGFRRFERTIATTA